MSKALTFCSQILWKLQKRREETAIQRFMWAAGQADAIAARLNKLQKVLCVHGQALHEMLQVGPDTMNLCLYRQCIGDIRRTIAADSRRLTAARKAIRRYRNNLPKTTRLQETQAVPNPQQPAEHVAVEGHLA